MHDAGSIGSDRDGSVREEATAGALAVLGLTDTRERSRGLHRVDPDLGLQAPVLQEVFGDEEDVSLEDHSPRHDVSRFSRHIVAFSFCQDTVSRHIVVVPSLRPHC